MRVPDNFGDWICRACDYQSVCLSNALTHVKIRHLRHLTPKLPCTLCEQSFVVPGYRQKHYRTRHGLRLTAKQISALEEEHLAERVSGNSPEEDP